MNNDEGVVLRIAPHGGIFSDTILAYVKVHDKAYIIEVEGLNKI